MSDVRKADLENDLTVLNARLKFQLKEQAKINTQIERLKLAKRMSENEAREIEILILATEVKLSAWK